MSKRLKFEGTASQSLADFLREDPRISLNRGAVVLESHLSFLRRPLQDRNIYVMMDLPAEMDDAIMYNYLCKRIIITDDGQRYISNTASFECGIIHLGSLSALDQDKTANNKTVKMISDAFLKWRLSDRRHGFCVELLDDGTSTFTPLVD